MFIYFYNGNRAKQNKICVRNEIIFKKGVVVLVIQLDYL